MMHANFMQAKKPRVKSSVAKEIRIMPFVFDVSQLCFPRSKSLIDMYDISIMPISSRSSQVIGCSPLVFSVESFCCVVGDEFLAVFAKSNDFCYARV